MTNIILCGGRGTRLWPISRTLMPKQFVKLFNNKSLFQLTVNRNSKLCDDLFIVSNTEQYFLASDQLEEIINHESPVTTRYLLEPLARSTAPAIALACMALEYDEIVLVTPSDHLIKNEKEYEKVLKKAKEFACENKLVTFGITPTFAETGFGYIESVNEFNVKAFHEKPDLKTASKYLEAGNYYWNSGMFCFKAGIFLDELKKCAPNIYESCVVAFENKKICETPQERGANSTLRIQHAHMEAILDESIDYAVMEKSNIVKVIPSNIDWSDVGSFDALFEELPKDETNNAILLTNNQYTNTPITIDSKNNLIISEKQVATVDIEDCIIIDTGDALLVSKKGSSQKVKQVVKQLTTNHSPLTNIHLTGHRPWGTYTVLEDSRGYKIKRIEVKAGCRLSLQKHFHRNEHWIVVSGCATVTVEDKTFILNPNESTYIKAGQVHRLENQGKLPLIIIEAQVGEYTGEDDIVRLDDDFKREEN